MARVELRQVWKRFGDVVAVRDFSLLTEDGEFVVLVGPSGCGKTSALRMIAGLELVSQGTISFDDVDVTAKLPRDRDIAMVFQNYALFPHLDVYSNIAFGMRLRKVPKAEIDRRVRQVARTLGIESLLGRRPRELSGGQRQRIALGRAIVREPRVFLMDEPLSNLDAALRMEMRAEIINLQRRLAVTTFYVTHDQVEALSMGDRIVVMRFGQIQQIGRPQELYERPANCFVASFIGSPPMNFIDAAVADGTLVLPEEEVTLPLDEAARGTLARAGSKDVRIGVRPEHISFAQGAGGPGAYSLPVTVDVVEPLGHTTLVHARLRSGRRLNVLLSEKMTLHRDQSVAATFTPDHLYLFDAHNEAVLQGISG
jgi:multiple sugar transport system ATP-binding protein